MVLSVDSNHIEIAQVDYDIGDFPGNIFFSLLHWWAIISLLSIVWDTDINYEKGGVSLRVLQMLKWILG